MAAMSGIISVRSKALIAIERLRRFEPLDGYWLAFSGGKDSQAIYHLATEAGVRFEPHYSLTTADPPELVRFIRQQYPDVAVKRPDISMWELIAKKRTPPTRLVRYCCAWLKEGGGHGRVVVTGIRWAESTRRANRRGLVELNMAPKNAVIISNDGPAVEGIYRATPITTKHIINPIIDWSTTEVWTYLRDQGVPHCSLYDEGFKRLGCIGCPQQGKGGMKRDFMRWPKYRAMYIRAFDRMLEGRRAAGLKTEWVNGEEVMKWWAGEPVAGVVPAASRSLLQGATPGGHG